ncbi:MAG: tail fiber domain-containing protein [Saprospiraceae bacterium]
MKHQIYFFSCICLALFLLPTSTSAQLTLSNNLGIYSGFPGAPFNPAGKFTAIGESGGGCDLYGFRAQSSSTTAVSLGVRRIFSSFFVPNLVFTSSRFWISDKDYSGSPSATCGQLISFFGRNTSNNTVFTLYGSAIANGGTWIPSDRTLKKDVAEIQNATDLVQKLRGVTYEYLTQERPELNLSRGLQYGFITQEVQKIMPNAVRVADDSKEGQADYQVMQYTQVIPVLTEALKEVIVKQDDGLTEQLEINLQLENKLNQQEKLINTLEDRLKALEARLNTQSDKRMGMETGIISTEGVSLRQNRPNPFQGETVIQYTIPSTMVTAQLVIYDLNGRAIFSSNLAAGDGQVNVLAADLSSGVYFYAIENGGQTLARQKMAVK